MVSKEGDVAKRTGSSAKAGRLVKPMEVFDNRAFTQWLLDFEIMLIDCGYPRPQAMRYRTEYYQDALAYFVRGISPSDAVCYELLAEPPDSDKLASTPDSDSVGPVVPTQPTAHRGEDTTLRRDVSSEGAE